MILSSSFPAMLSFLAVFVSFLYLCSIPTISADFSSSFGSYIITNRTSGTREYESMPISVRVGMSALFHSPLVHSQFIQSQMTTKTREMGEKYNSPSSKPKIQKFIKQYNIDVTEIEKNVEEYETFNAFFSRKLKPNARKIDMDGQSLVSPADSKVVVFENVTQATEIWIKGRTFTLGKLVGLNKEESLPREWQQGRAKVAVFRLAPNDYHRIHAMVDAQVTGTRDIQGQYNTVNPMAVKRPDLDVLGENRRLVINTRSPKLGQVTYVMVGALLVGSCKTSQVVNSRGHVRKGEELGWFEFGKFAHGIVCN